jgi:hypothetical protein
MAVNVERGIEAARALQAEKTLLMSEVDAYLAAAPPQARSGGG